MNPTQLSYKTYTAAIYKKKPHRSLSLGAHTGPPGVGGEGHTVPERVGPRGADNATNQVLVCLPCAQAVPLPGRRPLTKKKKKKMDAISTYLNICHLYDPFVYKALGEK